MFGTSPFASSTFAGMGSEEYELTASAITTGAVSVANTTFQGDQTLGALFILFSLYTINAIELEFDKI